jgi:hypothetical protein
MFVAIAFPNQGEDMKTLSAFSIASFALTLVACSPAADPTPPAPTAPPAPQQAESHYTKGAETLDVAATLPIDGKTVLHYRYRAAGVDTSLDMTSDAQDFKAFFEKLSPDMKQKVKVDLADGVKNARGNEDLSFLQLQEGVLAALDGDKVLFCGSHEDCQTVGCCSYPYSNIRCTYYSCSGWWIFCSCHEAYSYEYCGYGTCG